mgnify:CR=1 FL=1
MSAQLGGTSREWTVRASVGEALVDATRRFREAGVADPRRDACRLMASLLDLDVGILLADPERALTDAAGARYEAMVRARVDRQPVSRILGEREFWSLPFGLAPATLDPRPDSETLVEIVLARLPDRRATRRILDLGTGTGCLLLALLSELPAATGVGVDRVPEAVSAARANASRLGFDDRATFAVGDWAHAVTGSFDVIVSNPPYLTEAELAEAVPEVARWDPRAALDGGADGLAAYRRILPQCHKRVARDGLVVLEVGRGQADAVSWLAGAHGFTLSDRGVDLAGIERCVVATVAGAREG